MSENGMTYEGSGVNYGEMDPFKRMCQMAAKETAQNPERFGYQEVGSSRGESVYLLEAEDHFLGHVEEGLGTKNLVADEVRKYTGQTHYDKVAQCALAMIINDLITLGALPISTAMHIAVGSSDWFNDQERCSDLAVGWQRGCNIAGCVWGGGETPTLKDMIMPGVAILSGSGIGLIKPKGRLIDSRNIREGDAIVLLGSSGIHANGLTLAREIAKKLPRGYEYCIAPRSLSYGEAILTPTTIYAPVIEACLDAGINLHYTVNITGHGWRKLMRAELNFRYIIENIPQPQPIFRAIQEYGDVSDKEMYGNFNMGAGFALFVSPADKQRTIDLSVKLGIPAIDGGYIELSPDDSRKVIIEPMKLEYSGETLQVR
ncbi:AIR synthase-related protein [Patescibacteria group bacterium]